MSGLSGFSARFERFERFGQFFWAVFLGGLGGFLNSGIRNGFWCFDALKNVLSPFVLFNVARRTISVERTL